MPSAYFSLPATIADFTRARAANVNDLAAATDAAFALLPSPDQIAGGTANYGTTTGSGGDYYLAPSPEVTTLLAGLKVQFLAGHTNTTTARLKVNDLAFAALLDRSGVPITPGDIIAGFFYEARYINGSWRIQSPLGVVGLTPDAAVQTGVADDTPGRAMIVGAFGIGGTAPAYPTTLTSFDDAILPGDWAISDTTGLAPIPNERAGILYVRRRSSILITQTYKTISGAGGGRVFERVNTGSAWTAWDEVFTQANILGTVSQTAGVPTGALIETNVGVGAGADVRLANGTQITRQPLFTVDIAIATASGLGGFRTATQQSYTFPRAFASIPAITIQPTNGSFISAVVTDITTADVTFYLYAISSQSSATRSASILAVGRWF